MGTNAIENSRYLLTRVFIKNAPRSLRITPTALIQQPMRVAILGNAGSGMSTLASWLAERGKAERADLAGSRHRDLSGELTLAALGSAQVRLCR